MKVKLPRYLFPCFSQLKVNTELAKLWTDTNSGHKVKELKKWLEVRGFVTKDVSPSDDSWFNIIVLILMRFGVDLKKTDIEALPKRSKVE